LLLLGLLLFCLYYAIAATLSRGALLGFWAGIAVLVPSALRRVPVKYPIILLVVALAANGLANLQSRGVLTDRFDSALGSMQVLMDPSNGLSESGGSIHQRSVIWHASAELLRDAPWYGLGPSTFGLAYPAYSPVEDLSSLQYVHNDYLQFWIELGYPGVLLLLWLGLSVIWMFVKVIRSNDVADERRIEAAGLFAGMLAVAAHSVFTYNFNILAIAILFGFVLGRFVALAPTPSARGWCVKPSAILGKNAFYALSIIALMFPVSLLASFGVMDHFYTKAKAALIAGDLGLAEQSLTRAEQLFDTSDIQYARAVLYMEAIHALPGSDSARRKQFYELASGALERTEAVNPYESNAYFGRAMLYQDNPQLAGSQWFARASAAYQKTLDMDPRHYPARLAYAKLLAGNAEERNALALLEAGLAYLFPDDPQILSYARYLVELRRAQSDVEGAERIEQWIRVWEQHWRDEAAELYFSSR
ncbi:MAG: O-antigen ligase family protein, partial [Gammaproteobacteria bacterium]|nr:O-antigen ligase family protein [Gammaproteobacteria bacterium]